MYLIDPPTPQRLQSILCRPDDGVLELFAIPASEPLASDAIGRVVTDVMTFLLRHHRDDGSWRSTPDEMGATEYRTDGLTG